MSSIFNHLNSTITPISTPSLESEKKNPLIPLPRDLQHIIVGLAYSTLNNVSNPGEGLEKLSDSCEMYEKLMQMEIGLSIIDAPALKDNYRINRKELFSRLLSDGVQDSRYRKALLETFSDDTLLAGSILSKLNLLANCQIESYEVAVPIGYNDPKGLEHYRMPDNIKLLLRFATNETVYTTAVNLLISHENVFKEFIRAGLDINIQHNGKTLMHHLVQSPVRGYLSGGIHTLLQSNQNLLLRDQDGKTAADYVDPRWVSGGIMWGELMKAYAAQQKAASEPRTPSRCVVM